MKFADAFRDLGIVFLVTDATAFDSICLKFVSPFLTNE